MGGKKRREARMSSSAPMYVYATENVASYYKEIGVENKKVLTICGSGDQVLNAFYFKAKEVIGFDLNKKAEFITRLKISSILQLNYNQFLKLFGESRPNIGFSYQLYKIVRGSLDSRTRLFFDRLYKKFNYNGLNLVRSTNFRQRDVFGHGAIKKMNIYLKNEKNYNKMKSILKEKKFIFIQGDVKGIQRHSKLRKSKFDVINLSNTSGYITGALRRKGSENPIEEFHDSTLVGMKEILANKGKIIFYTYSNSMYPNLVAKGKPVITSPNKFKQEAGEGDFIISSKKVSGLTPRTFDKVVILEVCS